MAFLLTFSGGASATYKDAVRVARSTQLALTGSGAHPVTVDGVPLNDQDRVLLRGQTNAAENGIYVYSVSGTDYTLTRALDANNSNEVLPNMLVPVSEGTANADKIFQLSSYQTPPAAPEVGPIVLDTTELTFTDVLIGLANKADRDLANLLPTSINQSLLFADDTSYNIGASGASRPQTLYVKTAINLASLTASEILASDASKNVVSLSTATYPSLTELARVKGVTSGIQDQLNLKVDSVSGTAPISSSGGVTPTISISQSGAAQDGYLSSTDWNTFNNKQNALSFGDLTSSDITVTGGVGAVVGSGTSLSLTKGNLSETTSNILTITGGTSAVLGSGVTIEVAQSGSAQSGYLSSADWSTFNAKQDALSFGNLTEATSSVLTISGGTGAVIGSGSSIQVKQSGAAQDGYLSSTDWSTFNNKQPAGNYITDLTGDVTASGPGSVTASISNQSGNAGKFLVTNGTAVSWDVVVNENGADLDFRVEGDTDENLIKVDASNDAVGIGISGAVTEKLEVNGNVLVANHAVITQTLRARDGVGSAQHDILLRGGDGLTGNHDGGDVTIQGGLKHGTGDDGELIFKVAGAEAAKISASNNLDLSCGLIVNSAHSQAGTADVITVADDDFYVGVDCSLAAKTVNLPTAVAGKKLVIKDESGDASTNNITVSGTIDGAANYVMAVDYEALTLVSDGTNWFII